MNTPSLVGDNFLNRLSNSIENIPSPEALKIRPKSFWRLKHLILQFNSGTAIVPNQRVTPRFERGSPDFDWSFNA
ncbi:hypothetical protein J6590_056299, partial [Homalodisca vitripennis]